MRETAKCALSPGEPPPLTVSNSRRNRARRARVVVRDENPIDESLYIAKQTIDQKWL